jgi:hypothetical protein
MKSYIFKATLIIGIVFISVLPIVYAQDANGNNAVTTYVPTANNAVTTPVPTANNAVTTPVPGASNNTGTFTLHNPLDPKITSVGGLVQTIIDVISYILVLFGILALVWTGLQYVLAQGNSERIKELHKTLLAIVIGIAIVIGAPVIVQVVINTLKAANVVNSSTFNQVQNAAAGN